MATTFNDFLKEQLKDPEFKKEWDLLQPERTLIMAIKNARKENNLTQKDLAEKTGIKQEEISKIERGKVNPSLKTLIRLAVGMGKSLRLEFV